MVTEVIIIVILYNKKSFKNISAVFLLLSFLYGLIYITCFGCLQLIWNDITFPSQIQLNWLSQMRLIFNNNNLKYKRIYYGKWNNTKIVVKEYPSNTLNCEGHYVTQCIKDFHELVQYSDEDEVLRSIVICPSLKNFVNNINYSLLFQKIDFNFLTENIILQILKSQNGWHIPTYFGTWNNVLVEEYVGITLTEVDLSLWKTRAIIAKGLLKMAETFTEKHPFWSFYFTDISPDNVALRENLEPVLIDLDHVIIVDRTLSNSENNPGWDELHVSERFVMGSAFTFSTRDICQHQISDHNYYAVCEHILKRSTVLGNGLLTNIPWVVMKDYPELEMLRDECALPKLTSNRIAAGKQLRHLLETILQEGENK